MSIFHSRVRAWNAGQAGSRHHTLVFTFAKTLTNVSSASVESGTGSVKSSGVGADAYEYIVNLTGVPNAEKVQVKLRAITDADGDSTPAMTIDVGFLNDDTNGDRTVNSADGQTKAQSGAALTNSNFREDLNVDGFVNSADVSLAKSRSGTALPSPQQARGLSD